MDDKDLPILNSKTYVKDSALGLWETLPRVLLANFLWVLVSLPALTLFLVLGQSTLGILLGAFTAGPGWVAMCALIARALLREPGSFLEFFKAFKHFFFRGTILGALFALPLLSGTWFLPALKQPPVPTEIWAALGADVAGLFFLTLLAIYTVPLFVMYDLGVGVALKNSLVLAVHYFGNTIGLLSMAFLLVLLAGKVSLFLVLVLPGAWLVFVINNCRMVLRIELGESTEDDPSSARRDQ